MTLHIPVINPDDSTIAAALKLARAGWYTVPVSARNRKNPGSVLGTGWQHQSSRDTETIVAWFAGTDHLLALHVGRSGAVVFDVDHPEHVPPVLGDAIETLYPPYQSSRPEQHGRGHFVFAQPPGRMIGNGGARRIGPGWGDVRGKNGVILVAPSAHKDEAAGARYEWMETGDVPVLPPQLAELLPDATDATDAATDEEVARFVATHITGSQPGRLQGPLTKLRELVAEGGSRHESLVTMACWAAREAMAGVYPASAAFDALTEVFVELTGASRDGIERAQSPESARAEATGIYAWAIAQAEHEGIESVTERVRQRPNPSIVELHALAGFDPQNPQNHGQAAAPGGSESFEGASPGVWELPTPLPGRTDPIPTAAAGPVLGPLVEDIGRGLQVPTDLPINLALPLITTAAKGAWVAEVEQGWTEPVCVATLSALPSGERKSPTLRLLDQPLREFERAAQAAKRPEIAQQAAKKKLVEGRVEEFRKKALKGLGDGAQERAYLAEVVKLSELVVDPLPRWMVDDSTPEAFVSLLSEHGSIGAVSAEPGLFGILAGRYSSGTPNIEWLLKATSGETITVDRIGRDPEQVANPALSIACCIQPGRLVELGKVKAFRESGLLARWFYAVPRSAVGERSRTRQVQPHLAEAWRQHLTALAEAGAKLRDSGQVVTLRLDEDARDELERFRSSIEPHLHPDHGKYAGIADWMNKLPGGAVRIAAALTLLADPDALHIDGATMCDAVRIATAYVSHAIAAFGLTRPNAEVYSQAKQVLAIIRRLASGGGSVSRREVHQKIRDRAWVETADSLAVPFAILLDHGYIRPAPRPEGAVGRPSERYELNPHCLEIDPQNPQKESSEGFEGEIRGAA